MFNDSSKVRQFSVCPALQDELRQQQICLRSFRRDQTQGNGHYLSAGGGVGGLGGGRSCVETWPCGGQNIISSSVGGDTKSNVKIFRGIG